VRTLTHTNIYYRADGSNTLTLSVTPGIGGGRGGVHLQCGDCTDCIQAVREGGDSWKIADRQSGTNCGTEEVWISQ